MDNEEELASEVHVQEQDGSVKGGSKPATAKELLLRFGAVGNFGLQCFNIALASTGTTFGALSTTKQVGRGMIYGSSSLGALHSPVVVYKERQLTKEDTFRTALNGIREEQNRLAEQNDVLSTEIDDLQSEVDRLKDIEQALRELSEIQGTQMNELLDLVQQNKEINEGMRAVLKSKALEEVVSLVLDIDNDGSFTIKDREIDRLIIGMKLIEEITFNEEMFREEVAKKGGNVDEVIMLIKSMLNGTGPEPEEGCRRCTINISDPENWFKKERTKLHSD